MDPIRNPFAPGAGTQPPELAGRDAILTQMHTCLERLRIGNPAKSVVLVGLRGVGKTALLNRILLDAEARNTLNLQIEASEKQSLPAMLAPKLRLALLHLDRVEKAKSYVKRALKALAGFVRAMKVKYNDIEVGLDYEPEQGLADNGDLESDLTVLLEQVGLAAQAAGTVAALYLDELQYVKETELSALISALHRCAQKQLPITLIGAGLPQLRGKMGKAKTYAERLFDFPEIGPLSAQDANDAIRKPILSGEEQIEKAAVDLIVKKTHGYPYFLQEWGKQAWDVALRSPITADDVHNATKLATAALDESFFRVRFDRLTPMEKQYIRAMAELGPESHRSGEIAEVLQRDTQALGPIKNSLIKKGMIWSPNHGDTAFTVPLFDEFMKRIMPGDGWKTSTSL